MKSNRLRSGVSLRPRCFSRLVFRGYDCHLREYLEYYESLLVALD
jgi:hypothetical protein